MATRFYFPESQTTSLTPDISAITWSGHINTLRRALLTAPDGSALTTTAFTPDAADHLTDVNTCHRQYVSDRLAAQTISGNVKAQFQMSEANNGNNQFITINIFICSNESLPKESVLSVTRDTTTELTTTLTNRTFSSIGISSVDVEVGDHIVVEIGIGGLPTAAGGVQGHNASVRFGCNASSGDLPENDSETGTTFRPWIEFDDTITFEGFYSGPAIFRPRLFQYL